MMTERDILALQTQALATLAEVTQAVNSAPDVESALAHITAATRAILRRQRLGGTTKHTG